MCKTAHKSVGVDERERTIEEYLPVIKHLAFKFSKGFQDEPNTDDLISAGILGLLEAMDKYDSCRGTKLHTFAWVRIRGAMIDELRRIDWFPRYARTNAKKLSGVISELERKIGRYPTEEEVAEELEMEVEACHDMFKKFGSLTVLSIDEICESSGIDRESLVSFIIEDGDSPERCVELREMEKILGMEIDGLPQKQKMVLGPYYYEDMNMKEIGQKLGITQARISQIHSQAIDALRTRLQRRLNG
jgi:RNA polymerase sigma factor FliA